LENVIHKQVAHSVEWLAYTILFISAFCIKYVGMDTA